MNVLLEFGVDSTYYRNGLFQSENRWISVENFLGIQFHWLIKEKKIFIGKHSRRAKC